MRDSTVAARYAKALFIVVEKRRETARALEDLKGLRQVLEPGTRIADFLINPGNRIADKREVLRRAFTERVLPLVAIFIDLLMRKKRLAEFPLVVEEFEGLVEKALGITRAHVVSAVPLVEEEKMRLQEALDRYTNASVKLTGHVDPELIGGVYVRIGDRIVDRSVRTLLETIEKQLYEVSV